MLGSVSTKLSRLPLDELVLVARKVYVVVPPAGSTEALVSLDNVRAMLLVPIGGKDEANLLVSVCLICVPLPMNATGLTGVGTEVGPCTRYVATSV